MRTAILPGSYDPITLGHLDIIRRAASLFDRAVVLVAVNDAKNYLLDTDSRLMLVRDAIRSLPNVTAERFDGYIVDYAAECESPVLVKGVRDEKDFAYEREMASYNRALSLRKFGTPLETVYLDAAETYAHVSSTLVRTLIAVGGSIDGLTPNEELLRQYLPIEKR